MTQRNSSATGLTSLAALLALSLVACGPRPGTDEGSPPSSLPTNEAPTGDDTPATNTPATDAPAMDTAPPAPGEVAPPEDTPAAPAQPSENPPPPTEPSPAPKPTAANEPGLESMKSARPPAKAGVPVDLRYSFEGEPLTNQPVTLHLAAIPRVAGSNLGVSIKRVQGLEVAGAGTLAAQKANANGAYRQHYSVTRHAAAPSELRVLVTMDLPEGSAFGFYSIPLDAGTISQKADSVKQR